jgi:hypothetical protein
MNDVVGYNLLKLQKPGPAPQLVARRHAHDLDSGARARVFVHLTGWKA